MASFKNHFSIMLVSFWGHFWVIFGIMLGSFRDHVGVIFGMMLGSCWDDVGIILGLFWCMFLIFSPHPKCRVLVLTEHRRNENKNTRT